MDKSMEIKNGERKNQDKSKVMLVFDYDGTIQEIAASRLRAAVC